VLRSDTPQQRPGPKSFDLLWHGRCLTCEMNVPLIRRLWAIVAALLITGGVALWWTTERKDAEKVNERQDVRA